MRISGVIFKTQSFENIRA